MLLICGIGEDSWESFGLQGDPTSPSYGDQSWVFIGRTNVEAETPIVWPPDVKSWLIGKDPDAGKDWRREDGMVGWHHRLNGHGFGCTPVVGAGQGGLACCTLWGRKESDSTERLNWTELNCSVSNALKVTVRIHIGKRRKSGSKIQICCCSVTKLYQTHCDPMDCTLGFMAKAKVHGYARLPCPPPFLGVCSNSYPLSQWCFLTISSSANLFYFWLHFNISQHQGPRVKYNKSNDLKILVN